MASISRDKGGTRRIVFTGLDDQRRAIYLGRMPIAVVQSIRVRIESILAFQRCGVPFDAETAKWIGGVSDKIHAKLAKTFLVQGRQTSQLGPRFLNWIEGHDKANADTKRHLRMTVWLLTEKFGETTDLRSITVEKAKAWREWLVELGYAEATIARHVKRARELYEGSRLIAPINPFLEVFAGDMANRERIEFISIEDVDKMMAVATDDHWRLIVALSRYGGLRVVSETASLEWEDVDWVRDCITLWKAARTSTKKKLRTLPIFAELRPYLQAVYTPGQVGKVLPQRAHTNWREGLEKIIRKAGLVQWPRIWHNMRSSRETELRDVFPAYVVAEWLGHSEAIGTKHYSKPNDAHYRRAALFGAAQNPTRQMSFSASGPKQKKSQ